MDISSTSADFLPILLQILVAIAFAVITLWAAQKIGPSLKNKKKGEAFESGVVIQGDAHSPVSIHYFLIAIIFIIFDVEVIFMYPWAVNFKQLGMFGFVEMIVFISLLFIAFIYLIKSGLFKKDNF